METRERIDYFHFWQPVSFTFDDNPGTTSYSKWGYYIGSVADQYASLSTSILHVDAERIDARKLYFEKKDIQNISLWITALKVSFYVLSLGTLLAVSLVIKGIFKYHLNTSLVLTKKSPNEVIAEKEIGKSKIVLLFGSITEETTDVIVNAANARLQAGGGVCGAISDAAGSEPFTECREILDAQRRRRINCGEAVLTTSGDLAPRVKAIVHAVGPDYSNKKEEANGEDLLTAAYRNSLEIAYQPDEHEKFVSESCSQQNQAMKSIAFPSISTGIYAAPLDEAAPLALKTVKDFIEEYPDAFEEVRFVFLPLDKDSKTAPAYQTALKELE